MSKYEETSIFIKRTRVRRGKPVELHGGEKDHHWRNVEHLLEDASELIRRSQEVSLKLYGKIFGLYWEM